MIAYELATLRRVTSALGEGTEPSPARWISNVVVEALFPTIGLVMLIATGMSRPGRGAGRRRSLTYFLFISLSTLRLSPRRTPLGRVFRRRLFSAVAIYGFARYPTPTWRRASSRWSSPSATPSSSRRQTRRRRGGTPGPTCTRAPRCASREVEQIRGELETARTIQKGPLPARRLRLAGYDVAGWNQPADQTGGDYFGWQGLPDGRVAFTLADVTGHGIGAALVAATCHAYTRAGMAEQSELSAILDQLNRLLCDDLPPGKLVPFVTAALKARGGPALTPPSARSTAAVHGIGRSRPELRGAWHPARHLPHNVLMGQHRRLTWWWSRFAGAPHRRVLSAAKRGA